MLKTILNNIEENKKSGYNKCKYANYIKMALCSWIKDNL